MIPLVHRVRLHPELGLFIRKHLSALTLGLSDQLNLYTYLGQRTLETPGICFTPTRPSPSRDYTHQFLAPTNHIPFPQFLSGDLISACLLIGTVSWTVPPTLLHRVQLNVSFLISLGCWLRSFLAWALTKHYVYVQASTEVSPAPLRTKILLSPSGVPLSASPWCIQAT